MRLADLIDEMPFDTLRYQVTNRPVRLKKIILPTGLETKLKDNPSFRGTSFGSS